MWHTHTKVYINQVTFFDRLRPHRHIVWTELSGSEFHVTVIVDAAELIGDEVNKNVGARIGLMKLAEQLTHKCYTVSHSAEVFSYVRQAFHSVQQLLPHGV